MVVNVSLDQISKAATEFLAITGAHKVLAFHGEMGAGKTTFIEEVCRQLGVTSSMGSPTFSIINEYSTSGGEIIYHMDLYRLKDEQEAVSAGVEECLYSGDYCLVEWPEKATGILPDETIHCYLSIAGNNQRKLQINL